jgi:Fic family protein
MLGVIDESLRGLTKSSTPVLKESDRMQYFLSLHEDSGARVMSRVGARPQSSAGFTRKDYMQVFKTLSTATASRDLNAAVNSGVLYRTGEGNKASYQSASK